MALYWGGHITPAGTSTGIENQNFNGL